MLPPGHVAAGYLVAESLLRFANPSLGLEELNRLVLWGMFFSFAPDLDSFYSFAKEKAFTVRNPEVNDHRKFWSHAPFVWLCAGLAVYFLGTNEYIRLLGLLIWACSWSHFLLDSVEYGIMWLWPFSKKTFAIRKMQPLRITEPGFVGYWLKFLKLYSKFITFYLEILVLASAFLFYKFINL